MYADMHQKCIPHLCIRVFDACKSLSTLCSGRCKLLCKCCLTKCTIICVNISIRMHDTAQYTYAPNNDVLHKCVYNMIHHTDATQPLRTNTMLPPFHLWLYTDVKNISPAPQCNISGGRHTCGCDLTGTAACILNDNNIGFVYIQLTSSTSQHAFTCSTSC